MKILIVDDDYTKIQEISRVLSDANIEFISIAHETTTHSARQRLRRESFDMLLIDLHLPDSVGASGSDEGGILFFDMICLDSRANLPADVLFITGREDLIEAAHAKVHFRGGSLCQYGSNLETWRSIVLGRVRYASSRLSRSSVSYDPVDIALITALRTPELDAVLKLPYSWTNKRFRDDTARYYSGTISRSDRSLNVIACSAARKGMPSSAALAAKVEFYFRPRYLVVLGICAGVCGKTSLGDVIVADPTWDWGSGKLTDDTDGSSVFLAAPYQRPLDTQVANLAHELATDPSTALAIKGRWTHATPTGQLAIKVGPMASGASVLADSTSTLSIVEQHRELLAVEMEAYAVMAAAEYCGNSRPIGFAIKSVCDFADPKKGDDWQAYASYTSAAFADALFRHPMFGAN